MCSSSQFSLRTLFFAVTGVAAALGLIGWVVASPEFGYFFAMLVCFSASLAVLPTGFLAAAYLFGVGTEERHVGPRLLLRAALSSMAVGGMVFLAAAVLLFIVGAVVRGVPALR